MKKESGNPEMYPVNIHGIKNALYCEWFAILRAIPFF